MSITTEFSSQVARRFRKRGPMLRAVYGVTKPCHARVRRLLPVALLPIALAGCVTSTASVPNSPFLTAVVGLNPLRGTSGFGSAVATSSPSAMNANAAAPAPGAPAQPAPSAAPPAPPPASPPVAAPPPQAVTNPAADLPANPGADRKRVYPQIATASAGTTGFLASAPPPEAAAAGLRGRGGPAILLRDAVGAAVMSHPLMGAQAAKVTGSLADVRTAKGALQPQLQVFAGSGGSYLGSYVNYPSQFGSVAVPGSSRSDAGFTLRQLVYDFGAARADIARSKSLVDAERLRLADQAEDIAIRTVNAYLNLLEQEELIVQIDKVVADDNNFANLVKLSERQGNGTVADVNRIKSKVIEVEAFRTDIKTAYDTARDEFARLTKLESNKVSRPASILSEVPATFETAFEAAKRYNPSLLALSAAGVSFDHQLASQQAQRLPRVDLQGDGLVKHYVGSPAASTGIVDSRLMLMVSYKLLDGGVQAAQADRIREDRKANDFRTLDEKESIELNLRRFYQALSANRSKEASATQGIATAQKAFSLYLEQFKGGKRTVFEVLDSRMVVFTMHKNAVNARYEQLRAAYGILRNMGRLVETAIRS